VFAGEAVLVPVRFAVRARSFSKVAPRGGVVLLEEKRGIEFAFVGDRIRLESRRDPVDVGVCEDHLDQQVFDEFGVVEAPADRCSDDARGHVDRTRASLDGARARVRQRRERLASMPLHHPLGTPEEEHKAGRQHAHRAKQDPGT